MKNKLNIYKMKYLFKFNESDFSSKDLGFVDDINIDKSMHSNIPSNANDFLKSVKFIKKKFDINQFVDLGCGSGDTINWTSDYFKNNYGIEFSNKYVEYAKTLLDKNKISNYNIIKGDILKEVSYGAIPKVPSFVYSYLPFEGRSDYNKSGISKQSENMNKMFDVCYNYFPKGSIFYFPYWSYPIKSDVLLDNKKVDIINFRYKSDVLDSVQFECMYYKRDK
jgi:SAM-dependent methyltransferase